MLLVKSVYSLVPYASYISLLLSFHSFTGHPSCPGLIHGVSASTIEGGRLSSKSSVIRLLISAYCWHSFWFLIGLQLTHFNTFCNTVIPFIFTSPHSVTVPPVAALYSRYTTKPLSLGSPCIGACMRTW
jgi:hypothetical protein